MVRCFHPCLCGSEKEQERAAVLSLTPAQLLLSWSILFLKRFRSSVCLGLFSNQGWARQTRAEPLGERWLHQKDPKATSTPTWAGCLPEERAWERLDSWPTLCLFVASFSFVFNHLSSPPTQPKIPALLRAPSLSRLELSRDFGLLKGKKKEKREGGEEERGGTEE